MKRQCSLPTVYIKLMALQFSHAFVHYTYVDFFVSVARIVAIPTTF